MSARVLPHAAVDGPSSEAAITIPAHVLSQPLEHETILLNLSTGVYFGLDPIGTRVWQHLRERGRLGTMLAALQEEFEVEPLRLAQDVQRLMRRLKQDGLIEYA